MPTQNSKEESKIFQDYWNNLPLILKVKEKSEFAFLENESRFKILNVLSQGISDTIRKESKSFLRHALTAQELKSQIKKVHNFTITEANIHFHLQKLIDKGFITEVLEIETGRRPKKYYGRTAKLFLSSVEIPDTETNHIEIDEFSKKLTDLIVNINPSVKRSAITEKFNNIHEAKSKIDIDQIGTWMETYRKEITDLEIDFKELFLYLNKALTFNSDFLDFYTFILDSLKIKDDSK